MPFEQRPIVIASSASPALSTSLSPSIPSSPASPNKLRRRSTRPSPSSSPLLPQGSSSSRPRRRKVFSHCWKGIVVGLSIFLLVYFGLSTNRIHLHRPAKVVTTANNLTFTEYLESHFPLAVPESDSPHLFLTIGDKDFTATGAANLHGFFHQLNAERRAYYREFGRHVRESVVITLCLDTGCAEECRQRDMYCYEGFESTRPPMIRQATWPKLASLIEALPDRDLFFVDADVGFKQDPYPHLEPLMKRYDVLAQENDVFDHFNTGFLWMRKGPLMAQAWNAVLEMDLIADSRDQVNLNTFLETSSRRRPEGKSGDGKPLLTEFVASNGLVVHILDRRLFRIMHLMEDNPIFERHDSLIHHMTCADDKWVKLYIAKSQGYWSDVDEYYTRPPPLISLEHLSATGAQLTQHFQLLLAAAHYTGRAVLPPAFVTVTDVPSSPTLARHSPSTFPLAHIGRAYNLTLLEPEYLENAHAHLLGRSALNPRRTRDDPEWNNAPKRERRRRNDAAVSLARSSEIDLRNYRTFFSLIKRLLEPDLASAPHIRFVNSERSSSWLDWRFNTLPTRHLQMCEQLELGYSCNAFCRGAEVLKRGPIEEEWTELESIDW